MIIDVRNYKAKMALYRLPAERYKELRQYCLNSSKNERIIIETALQNAFGDDGIAPYILKHVVSTDYRWSRLEAEQIPCSRDTFCLYRAKFYSELDKLVKRGGH